MVFLNINLTRINIDDVKRQTAGMGLPRWPELFDHPDGWIAGAMFPAVLGDMRLGLHRRPSLRFKAAVSHQTGVPACTAIRR